MKQSEAYNLAVELMDKHGLLDKGWSFNFDDTKRRFGVCRYRSKTIGLSLPLTLANQEAEVRDTILHEIAHALVGPGNGHNEVWKAKCREIGCRDQRCYTHEYVVPVVSKYKAVCGGCGVVHRRHKKLPRGRRVACKCQSSKPWDKKILLTYTTK